jgi:ligand-binding SRPBCC domain-containing protein
MISQITQIAKIENLLANLKTARFNAVLPVTIEVVKKSAESEYLLQVGTKEIATKTQRELDVGSKYWGVMREDPTLNSLTLSKLLKKPKFLQMQRSNFLPEFTETKLADLISKENPKAELKAFLQEKLAQSTNKSEFMTLANMISALNENVFTLVLKDEYQNTMFQFKKRKKSENNQNEDAEVDFYAAFEHLGPVEGVVSVINDERKLSLSLFYEESLEFLKNELENLNLEVILYKRDREIEPIYDLSTSLLDLRG